MKAPSSSLARSAVFLFLATAGLAQTAIWIAPGPSVLPPPLPTITTAAWNTAANWDGGVPTATTDVYIPARSSLPYINTTGAACNNLVIANGGSLTVNPSFKLTVNGTTTIY